MRRSFTFAVAAACAVTAGALEIASNKFHPAIASAAPAAQDGLWFVSPMKVRTEPAMSYLAVSGKASFGTMSEEAPKRSQAVREAMMKGAGRPIGASMFIYHGAFPKDSSSEFDVDIGLPIAEGGKSMGDVKVQALPEFKCASVLFAGRMDLIREAYASLLDETATAGLEPTGERRERYLSFHGVDADDNVVMIELGVK